LGLARTIRETEYRHITNNEREQSGANGIVFFGIQWTYTGPSYATGTTDTCDSGRLDVPNLFNADAACRECGHDIERSAAGLFHSNFPAPALFNFPPRSRLHSRL
jgi:hypothetical protein